MTEPRTAGQTAQALYADLAGVREIAVALDVPVFRVKRWIERRASTCCPAPVAVLSHGAVYSLAAWRSWFSLWRVTRAAGTERV